MKHNYTKGSMIGLSVAFMILPLTFMSLRVWAKIMGKRFSLDDYLAVGALVSLNTYHSFFFTDWRQLVSFACCILQLASKDDSTAGPPIADHS
jgi:hypothetical protein